MARKATGAVVERQGAKGKAFALRFRAYGKREYLTLGTDAEGWTRARAEEELENTLADVRRGIWRPGKQEVAEPPPDPTFHEFASEWYAAREPELAARTQVDYRWRLSSHLLPFFAKHRLSQITVEEVDRYRTAKVRERDAKRRARAAGDKEVGRPLSNSTVNMTLTLLGAILETAVEYGHLPANPARGKRRRLKQEEPTRSFLQPEQVQALIAAAGGIDDDRRDQGWRKPLIATLCLAGLRISEAMDLRWRHLDLSGATLRVAGSKTDAGVRGVELTPALRELLAEYRARATYASPDDFVFPTRTGRRNSDSNIRNRLLVKATERADAKLEEDGSAPMPEGVTPHSLRRTFISILLATGADPRYVMGQVGHTDPSMTLRVYAQVIRSGKDYGTKVDILVGAGHWARTGTSPAGLPLENGRSTVA
ncbi:MAG TPA: tyrosine-type recombinase/integrase [Thermoleophilaceae bacterium]|nr:tyrosine-type recombinase/integrase [Thermoleophilaceae bacterium]